MVKRTADYFPGSFNMYVPAAQYAADVHIGGVVRVNFGSPAAADTDGLLDGVNTTAVTGSITVTGNANLGTIGATADAPFGRNVTVTGAGSGAKVLTIHGKDYLGQPMSETITCTSGDGTGKKAFYEVTSIDLGAVAGDSNSDFGWGSQLGLPYKTIKVLSEELDGAIVGTLGTVTTAVLTDPQTATTGDPRGTYAPNSTLTGSAELTASFLVDNSVNSDNNGGLFGIKHIAT